MTRRLLYLAILLLSLSSGVFAKDSVTKIGVWYDDLGSKDYGNSTLTLEREGARFFISRRNGDGSGSRYRVEKSGNQYVKVGDKFGAKYVITDKGLEIHDRAGYIRTAKKK